jgi:hypothetical protein
MFIEKPFARESEAARERLRRSTKAHEMTRNKGYFRALRVISWIVAGFSAARHGFACLLTAF